MASFTMKSFKSTIIVTLPILLLLLFSQLLLVNAHGGVDHDEDNSHSSSDVTSSKRLKLVKIWCLLIFFFSTFCFGISPYFLRWNESFLLLGTQFAAGIFLGTSMMHFLSDSTSTFEALTSIEYPFSFMLACAGYMLTMLGDCVVFYIAKKSSEGKNKGSRVENELVEDGKPNDGDEDQQGRVDVGVMQHHPVMLTKTTSVSDTFLLIIALCFHSIFEGMAVGIADTEADAWRNLWTITLHKVFAAIAMGIALLKMIPKRPFLATVAYSFAFAISSPVGVGIGIAASQGAAANWTYAITMGFACGIFIYVAVNHLIAKGYQPQSPCYFDTPFFKFIAVLVGVAVMAVVMAWD